MNEAPTLITLDDNDEAQILVESISGEELGAARRAVAVCPKAALSIIDD